MANENLFKRILAALLKRNAAQGRPIPPAVVDQATQGVKPKVAGVDNGLWFSPEQPLAPQAQDQAQGRRYDYPVGYNLRWTPRAEEGVSFAQLRALADTYDLLRLLIETRKDQLVKIEWTINKIDIQDNDDEDDDPRIKEVTDFLKLPDREHTWQQWLRMLVEEMLVTDAATIYPRRTYAGKLYSLDLMDGTTIKPLIDYEGRTPAPPSAAFQQVLHGVPAVDYSSDELIYCPRNLRVNKVYGYSNVEQVVMTVNIGLRRQLYQLQYYTEGSLPDQVFGTPATWNIKQIKEFQDWFDGLLSGNTGARRKARFVPGDIKSVNTKEVALKDPYDEWLARICCFCFSIAPTPFIQQVNRATAESAQEAALEEGLLPMMNWVRDVMNRILWRYFGYTDLEFGWQQEAEVDPVAQAKIDDMRIRNGSCSIDEVRAQNGLDPIGVGNAIIGVNGPIFVGQFMKDQEAFNEAQSAGKPTPMIKPPGVGGDENGDQPPSDEGKQPPANDNDKQEPPAAGGASKVTKKDRRPARASSMETSIGDVKVVWKYDVAYLGGGSKNFVKTRTVYLDCDFDPYYPASALGGKGNELVDVTKYLCEHEAVEGEHEKTDDYETAHSKYANPAEKKAIQADGYDYKKYNDALKPALAAALKKAETKKKYNPPPDIIEKPYDHPRCKLQRKLLRQMERNKKFVKAAGKIIDPVPINLAGRAKGEREFTALLKPFFAKQGKLIAAQINDARKVRKADDDDIDDIDDVVDALLDQVDLDGWAVLHGDASDIISALAAEGAVRALQHLGIRDDDMTNVANERALEWAKKRAAELVGKKWIDDELVDNPDPKWAITESTRGMLRGTVTRGIEEGWSNAHLASEIEESYAFSPARASMIARTEMSFADSNGNREGFAASGVVKGKIWLESNDDNVCDECAENADAGEVAFDDEFPSGDEWTPGHPQCQCTVSPVV